MGFSANQLQQVVIEIGGLLTGGVIQKIDQPQPWDLVFEIHQRGKRHFLYFSAHRRHARFHLLEKKYENPATPPRFSQLLRAHLRWKRIVSLEQIGNDRIIQMKCAWAGEGPSAPLSLIAEMMGPASNFYLIDSEEKILGSLFPLSEKRGLRIGAPYQPPPVSRTPSFKEAPIPLLQTDLLPFNRSVERYFRTLEEKEAAAESQTQRLSEIDAGIRRHEKKINQLLTGLTEAEKSPLYRRQGELLKSHLHEIEPGMKEFRLIDPAHPEKGEVVLALDPALSPSQNLERIFKRYKKAQTAHALIQTQIEKTKKERDRLEKDRQTILNGGLLEVTKRPPTPSQKDKSGKTKAPAYLSSDGLILLVGRNDRENDEVTFRVARGNDLWFHARGIPGSHVVVRMERRQEIPYQTLLDAATLALYFSDGRKTGKGDVLYTFRKYVQKPKGEKPGKVLCSQDKNIYIEVEPARLDRLFQAKVGPT
jgi:predicted ribosome quality control (RQC) complex YloA/Tae2 family protein